MPEKYKPQSVTQEQWDALPPVPISPESDDTEEPDDFAEIFVATLNANVLKREAEDRKAAKATKRKLSKRR